MRSSASTRSPPEQPIRLYVLVVGDDHPRACTGRRLLRLGLAQPASRGPASAGPILLDPYAPLPLSGADRTQANGGGLLAIDCSWNRLSDRRARFGAGGAATGRTVRRRLPMLLAANPQHYGRLGELNTVEALAAALAVLGRRKEAETLVRGFAGGRAFLSVNAERLDRYTAADSAQAIAEAERAAFVAV